MAVKSQLRASEATEHAHDAGDGMKERSSVYQMLVDLITLVIFIDDEMFPAIGWCVCV